MTKRDLRSSRLGGATFRGALLAAILAVSTTAALQAAAPYGHFILAKRLAENIRDGKVPDAPRELVEALKDPEAVRFFAGGAVAPDLKDSWTHHDGHPQTIGAGLMQSARNLMGTADRTGSPAGQATARQGLAFAYGWLHHCATDLAIHPAVNAVQGDAFSYTSPLKQGMHGNMESGLDAYIQKFIAKPGEIYDPAFPMPEYVEEKLGLFPGEFESGRNALSSKVAAELGLKNVEKMDLSSADFQAKWGQELQQADLEAKQFIAGGRLPGDWDLDVGRISSKDFRRFHNQVVSLNGGKVPAEWGRVYLDWWDQIKNLDEQARLIRLIELLRLAGVVPGCFGDLDDKLNQIQTARDIAVGARALLKAALDPIAAVVQARSRLDSAPILPSEVAGAAALILTASAKNPKPVFEKLRELEQAADAAQLAACKAADAASRTPNPSSSDVSSAQQSAADAGMAAQAAETAARPILDACKSIRDQLQPQKDLAERILAAKEAADEFPALLSQAEAALPTAREHVRSIQQAKIMIEGLYTSIVSCAYQVEKELTPHLKTYPGLAGRIQKAESVVANCLSPRQTVIGLAVAADADLTAAEGEVNLAKAKIAGLPDFEDLGRQWLALLEAGRDYLAGGATVEAWLGRIQKLAELAKKCADRAKVVATTAAATAPDPALGGKVQVPVVTALTEQAAVALLKAKRLTPRVQRLGGAPSAPESAIVNAQAPDAGTLVEAGTVVDLVMGDAASTQPLVITPNVIDLSAVEAYARLTAVGLLSESDGLLEIPPAGKQGKVKTQMPAGGETIRRGNIVRLKIYGRVVPSVIGHKLGAATFLLGNAGLKPDRLVYGSPPPRPDLEDSVLRQDPAPGASLPADKIVKVWVYGDYTGIWFMPEVIGLDKRTALSILAGNGLLQVTTKAAATAPSGNQAGTVQQQTPFTGSSVNKDTAVELTVFGIGVPDVRSWKSNVAQAELAKAGFKTAVKPATPSVRPWTKEQEFTVQRQWPAAGGFAEEGSTVELAIYEKYEAVAASTVQAPKKLHLKYVVDKVTGTSSAGTPRDWANESSGELPGLDGSIPLAYSETWDTGFANMTGSISIASAAPGTGAPPNEIWVTVRASASWSAKGHGFGRPTGIFISKSSDKAGNDDKGSFDNGSISAGATWTGPLGGGLTVTVKGKQNRIVTFSVVRD